MKTRFLSLLAFAGAFVLACGPAPVRASDSYSTVTPAKPGTPPLVLTVNAPPLPTTKPFASSSMAENFASRVFNVFKHHGYVGTINYVDTGGARAGGPTLAIEIIRWEPGHVDGMVECKFRATLVSGGQTLDLGMFDNSDFLRNPGTDQEGRNDASAIPLRELAARLAQTGLVPGFSGEQGTDPAPAAGGSAATPAERPKLAIVVVETLQDQRGAITAFDRLDLAFQHVARERKWPVTIAAERFAANTPEHETELRIFNQPLHRDIPGELTFRGWMVLTVKGEKHDFGIISYRYNPRPFEDPEVILEHIYRGVAKTVAEKIEPLLFPPPAGPRT